MISYKFLITPKILDKRPQSNNDEIILNDKVDTIIKLETYIKKMAFHKFLEYEIYGGIF